MRRGTTIFMIIAIIAITFGINTFRTPISLLFEDCSNDAIPSSDIPAPSSDMSNLTTQLIPKIIHQTYLNSSIPLQWKDGQQSCLDLHPDYEYKLWTDDLSREFIESNYPWFLSSFDNYRYPIQRADSIRYFILLYYGGIYIDLDDGCNRRLDPLLSYPAWVRRTVPTGISNDAMGAVPQHPFFLRVIESLQSHNRSWVMPYITIMASTGPLFLSIIWKQYIGAKAPSFARVRILMPDEYRGHAWSFFNISKGSSWHGRDAQTIFWMGKHWLFLTITGFFVAGALGLCLWWVWAVCFMSGRRIHSPGRRRMWPWTRISRKTRYELLDRIA